MSGSASLAGALWLRPGAARPHNLRSTRPDLVARVTHGLPAARLPGVLGSLFSLCSHAHAVCGGMAVRAAHGRDTAVPESLRAAHAFQTLREHLRRIGMDWPRQLAEVPPTEAERGIAVRALASCPALAASPGDPLPWIESHWLGHAADDWLAAWSRDPSAALDAWSRSAPTGVAASMRGCRTVADAALPTVPALRVHADPDALRAWADGLDAARARQPQWQGRCAETGPWTRLSDAASLPLVTPWLRLGARLAEVLRLAQPGGAQWLNIGALTLGDGAALAWVEMARGLLIHHVQLEGRGDGARVAACHVVAPTEWNFHPSGAVARVIERMPEVPDAADRRTLAATMAAYDPCVTFELEPAAPREVSHA